MNGALSFRKLSRKEYEAKYGKTPTQEEFDTRSAAEDLSFLSDWRQSKPSDSLESIAENDVESLDAMIGSYGLARVLKGLSDLCDSRAPSEFDCGSTFADIANGEEWHEYSTAIEAVIAGMK